MFDSILVCRTKETRPPHAVLSHSLSQYNSKNLPRVGWKYFVEIQDDMTDKFGQTNQTLCSESFQNMTLRNHDSLEANRRYYQAEYLLKLHSGGTIMASDIKDLAYLVELLPLVASVNSKGLIEWLETMDVDTRREVIKILNGMNFEGDVVEDVDRLIHFEQTERILTKMLTTINLVETGDFVSLVSNMTQEDLADYKVTFAVMKKSINAYKEQQKSSQGQNVSLSSRFVGTLGYLDFGLGLAEYLSDFPLMLKNGDNEALITGGMMLLGTLMLAIAEDFLPKIVGSQLGFVFGMVGVLFAISGICENIDDLVNGNLDGIETAIVVLDLVSNIITIAAFVGELILNALFPGTGIIVTIIATIVQILINIAQTILTWFRENKAQKQIDAMIDMIDSSMDLSEEEKKRLEQAIKDGTLEDEELYQNYLKRSANDQVVLQQLDFLVNNNMFEMTVFPSMRQNSNGDFEFYPNSIVDLTERKRRYLKPEAPSIKRRPTCNPPKFGHYIVCAPTSSSDVGGETLNNGFYCQNAIALQYRHKRAEKPQVLINLDKGNDEVLGINSLNNMFVVDSGHKQFSGGGQNDSFILNSTEITGSLDGMGGSDVLVVSSYLNGRDFQIDLRSKRILFQNQRSVGIQNVEIVSGIVNGKDQITVGCDTQAVVGNGGGDIIKVPSSFSCSNNVSMVIQINGTATIENLAPRGTYLYNIHKSRNTDVLKVQLANVYYPNIVNFLQLDFTYDNFDDAYVTASSNGQKTLHIKTNAGKIETTLMPLARYQKFHASPHIKTVDDTTVFVVSSDDRVGVIYTLNKAASVMQAKRFGDWTIHVNASCNNVIGNNNNGTFVIHYDAFAGLVDGTLGSHNHLTLGEKYQSGKLAIINTDTGKVRVGGLDRFIYQNIQQFSGRPDQSDEIIVSCFTVLANPLRGKLGNAENKVTIPSRSCSYDLIIRMDDFMAVDNSASNSNFNYLVPFQSFIDLDIDYDKKLNNTHNILFEFGAREIINGTILSNSKYIELKSTRGVKLQIPVFEILPEETMNSDEDPNIVFGPTILTNETGFLRVTSQEGLELIFNITSPEYEVIGSPGLRNIFFLNADITFAQGGMEGDVFFLNSDSDNGMLNGGLGIDVLILSDTYKPDEEVYIDMTNNDTRRLSIINIDDVFGRKEKTDIITAACDTRMIDGFEGFKDNDPDVYVFNNLNCTFNTRVVLRNRTVVDNDASSGNFVYNIVEQFGYFNFLTNVPTLNHTGVLNFTQEFITNITFNKENLVLTFNNTIEKPLQIQFQNLSSPEEPFYPQPGLLSQDIIQFRINSANEPLGIHTVASNYSIGFPFIRNNFLITVSTTNVTGGDFIDTFIFLFANETTTVQGNSKENIIVVNGTETSEVVKIVPYEYILQNQTPPGTNIIFKNITIFSGREAAADHVTLDCNSQLVNLRGGENSQLDDKVYIPHYVTCNYTSRVSVVINDHTSVKSDSIFGNFEYILTNRTQDYTIDCATALHSNHVFSVGYNMSEIFAIKSNLTQPCSLSILLKEKIDSPITYMLNNTQPCFFPKIWTKDYFEIRVSPWSGIIYTNFLDMTNKTIPELQESLYPESQRLNTSMLVMSNSTKEVIQIAGNHSDFIFSSPSAVSHMMGSGFENYFMISKGENNTVARAFLYSQPQSYNNINLAQLVRSVRKHKASSARSRNGLDEPLYIPDITLTGNNLNVFVETTPQNHAADLVLVDYRDWYSNTTVVLHEVPMKLEQNNQTGIWTLIPIPVNVTNSIQIVDQNAFEDNQNIIVNFPCEVSNQKTTISHSGDHLVITNAFSNHTAISSTDFFVMTFDEYLSDSSRFDTGKPRNVSLKFNPNQNMIGRQLSGELLLDTIITSQLSDVIEVIVKEREELNKLVFGFTCKAEGFFPHPSKCNVYYECFLIPPSEFIQYEFTCPTGTVYCKDTKSCGYPTRCPCD